MDILTFGERVMVYRKRAHLTKKELAERVGVTSGTLSKYEDDKSYPEPEIMPKLAVALNVSLHKLLYGFQDPAKNAEDKPLIPDGN